MRLHLAIIHKCTDCSFYDFYDATVKNDMKRLDGKCHHPKLWRPKRIGLRFDVPDWCPLEKVDAGLWDKLNKYFDLPIRSEHDTNH